jgi:hypothetical protein
MKTVLKAFLIIIGAVLCLRLLRLFFGLGLGLMVLLAPAVVVGLGTVGALLCVVLGLAAALSPIWLPVLAVIGLVTLWNRVERTA